MVRKGDWELYLIDIHGNRFKEHDISDMTVVQADVGKGFRIGVKFSGDQGVHMFDLWVGGARVDASFGIDTTGETSLKRKEFTFDGFVKRDDGQIVVHQFQFSTREESEVKSQVDANALSSQWEGGEIQLRVKRGKIVVVGEKDVHPGNKPTFKSSALSESTMVKGGHSATVGTSSKSFDLSVPWKVGDKSVASLSPNGPPDLTLTICFRDSMFMLKHGKCEESSKLADRAPPPKSEDKTTLKRKATVQTDFIDLYNAQDSDEEPAVPLD